MSPELIGILTVGAILLSAGIGLAGLIITNGRALIKEIAAVESRLREEMKQSESHLRADIKKLDDRVAAVETRLSSLEQRVARLEGLLDGLREAVTHARTTP